MWSAGAIPQVQCVWSEPQELQAKRLPLDNRKVTLEVTLRHPEHSTIFFNSATITIRILTSKDVYAMRTPKVVYEIGTLT